MDIAAISGLSSITDITSLSSLPTTTKTDSTDSAFSNILSNLISNVNQTDQVAQEDIINIATGNADDLHTIKINSEKAELALLTLVQVRNKVLDAYNEIMKVTL
ncbi:MAG: flagellar hook-basal body complex protein FliE [Oscillospiraceae bacterium]|nr:flagellar hook-basal body complex protein FliE [Oscillospiraceae bacterium]